MAVPRLGQKRSDGKVYAGSHYGYQSPATFNKLKQQGETSKGSETRRNIQQAVRPAVQAAQDFQSKFRKATDNIPGIQALERGVNNASDVASKTPAALVAQGGSIVADKAARQLDIDPKLAATALLVGRVAVGGRGGGGSSARPTTRRLPTSARPTGTVRPNRPSVAARTAASSSPGIAGRISQQQAAANAAKAAKANRPSKVNVGLTSGGQVTTSTAKTARAAEGPLHSGSSGTGLAPGNVYEKHTPSNAALTRSNKSKAVTNYGKKVVGKDLPEQPPKQNRREFPRSTRLDSQADNSTRNSRGWNDASSRNAATERELRRGNAYQPNSGRVNPRIASKFNRAESKAMSQAGKGLRGAERTRARNGARGRVREITKTVEQRAQHNTELHQRHRQELAQDGSTRSSIESMSRSMVNKPRVQGPRRPPTTTTGTRRIPQNAKSGVSTTKTPDGDVKRSFGQGARSLNPETGRPDRLGANGRAVTNKPSPSRKRGSNPAENFPQRSGRAPLTGSTPNRAGGEPIKSEAAKRVVPPSGSGFDVRGTRAGNTGGIRPVDSRGSTTPTHYQGSATKDTVQRRGTRKAPKKTGRLGQPGSTPQRQPIQYSPYKEGQVSKPVNTPEAIRERAARTKAAAEKAAAREGQKPVAPTRNAAGKARLDRLSAERAQSRADRRAGRVTSRDSKATQASARADYNNQLPVTPGTNRAGEVRMQGSKKGNQFVTGIHSYNDPTGRVPKASAHDGAPTRVVGKPKNQSRSAEAAKQTAATMEKVRLRALLRAARNHKYRPGVTKNLKRADKANAVRGKQAGLLKAISERLKGRRR
jgi:hypothetical protein